MKHLLVAFLCIVANISFGQILKPVKWNFQIEDQKERSATLVFTANIDEGWHVYSQFIEDGGPIPTSFHFDESEDYTLKGKVEEVSKVIKGFDKTFEMDIAWFENKAVFKQNIEFQKSPVQVKGYLEFMVCDDHQCLPPTEIEFDFNVTGAPKAASPVAETPKEKVEQPKVLKEETESTPKIAQTDEVKPAEEKETEEVEEDTTAVDSVVEVEETEVAKTDVAKVEKGDVPEEDNSLWAIFVAGFIGGLAAIFMPCIFPMLPLTVSYFTKQASKGSGVGKALIYALSIIVIYVVLGLIVTVIFGASALNALSTNGIFNIVFFLLLVVFAASFFGAFEITLPTSWSNKLDSKADRGGMIGIFFMAATLAIVSFSCTGPIIGALLVQAANMGELMGPAVGMFGFSLALAIPFALFAMFPSWMQALPKSGGWLNSVKVVLGFLEMALALKFLSNVDLAYHWEWFDREVFLVLWIVIFGMMGLYLIGKIKFAHDSPLNYLSFPRLALAVVTFSFTLYLVPGLWGAPLSAVAAFLPPQHTQDFDLYTASLNPVAHSSSSDDNEPRKYGDKFHAPLGLKPFYDYEQGLAYAKKVGKPVMIDFTGHACVNCRKMEASVWPEAQVYNKIANDYVLIQLYVDDKSKLAEEDQFYSEYSKKDIETIGGKWSDLQASVYNANSQPFYVLLSPEEELLAKPVGAVYDADEYAAFLNAGLEKYKESK
ncbi:thioredoxin family protein [Fulvivirga maritima]|uniref:protein-disulfide reductase DsbD family protein n=1 Tax=Fulvivirga maritima TaxID=2904247 RepID=UPI001F18C16B|nr:cytochrome c biogenesis protein CcdA [Fulvivirga maritima]UII26841.1 thioredoxin family protein [Fulvivirga maritima]